jgi:hypothetical protein
MGWLACIAPPWWPGTTPQRTALPLVAFVTYEKGPPSHHHPLGGNSSSQCTMHRISLPLGQAPRGRRSQPAASSKVENRNRNLTSQAADLCIGEQVRRVGVQQGARPIGQQGDGDGAGLTCTKHLGKPVFLMSVRERGRQWCTMGGGGSSVEGGAFAWQDPNPTEQQNKPTAGPAEGLIRYMLILYIEMELDR